VVEDLCFDVTSAGRLDSVCQDERQDGERLGRRLVAWALGEEHGLVQDPATLDREREAAFLRERLRSGELPLERLRLAAYANYTPARAALEAEGHPLPDVPGDLVAWLLGARAWGDQAAVRALMTVADTFVHADVTGDGVLLRLVGFVTARGPVREAQRLVEASWDAIWENRSRWPDGDAREQLEEAALGIEAHARGSLRLRLVPGLRARLQTWVDVLRVWDDFEAAARACAELDAEFQPISPRWAPLRKARQETVEAALAQPERVGSDAEPVGQGAEGGA
jgi:hypothetical protein